MPWPNNLAAKIVSGYIGLKYDILASDLRRFNPPMGALPFYNNSASPEIRRAELGLVAGKMIKFLTEMGLKFEPGRNATTAHTQLVAAMEPENAPSADIVKVIDANFRFMDEADE